MRGRDPKEFLICFLSLALCVLASASAEGPLNRLITLPSWSTTLNVLLPLESSIPGLISTDLGNYEVVVPGLILNGGSFRSTSVI